MRIRVGILTASVHTTVEKADWTDVEQATNGFRILTHARWGVRHLTSLYRSRNFAPATRSLRHSRVIERRLRRHAWQASHAFRHYIVLPLRLRLCLSHHFLASPRRRRSSLQRVARLVQENALAPRRAANTLRFTIFRRVTPVLSQYVECLSEIAFVEIFGPLRDIPGSSITSTLRSRLEGLT